jgi:hypothetical protein
MSWPGQPGVHDMVAAVLGLQGFMLNVIITTHESERTLVSTLAALVPGATAGLVGEVVIADAGSRDATAEVAEIAGCRLMTSQEPLGARLKAAVATTRAPWLMFLRAGCVPEAGWVAVVERFMAKGDRLDGSPRAAVFRRSPGGSLQPGLSAALAVLRAALAGATPDQGLLIARGLYSDLAGHPAHDDAETALLRRLGRRRIGLLASGASRADT